MDLLTQELHCPHCGVRERLRPNQWLERLRASGVLRRAIAPAEEEIRELLRVSLDRMLCGTCGARGLALSGAAVVEDDDDWGDPRPCEECGALIPAERLALFPDVGLCVNCQQASERGQSGGAAEYCPTCGTILQLRQSRGSGIARYALYCPACRR
jgi:hypothetical protein